MRRRRYRFGRCKTRKKRMSVSAGRLRERVRFDRRPTVVDDGTGNTLGDWETYLGPVWAEIKPMRGGEVVQMARLTGTRAVEITIRSTDAARLLTTDDRAVNTQTGEIFAIRLIEDREMRKHFLNITCEAGVADG
jgi:SPP1 family predicted phage head-tail adaptor